MSKILNFTVIFFLLKISVASAEIIKPSIGIKPARVIQIQLEGLKKNDTPNKDRGIEQTWEFAHPSNQRFTGPLSRFKKMIKGENFSILLNHFEHQIYKEYISDKIAIFEVTILDSDKKYYKIKWQVEKYLIDGPLKDCWLTTAVSQPKAIGSSI